jgi:hypothetical protein
MGYTNTNTRFLQCSNNIKITGKNNPQKKCFEIKQIFINNQPLLDNFGNPVSNRKYKCAIDSFIADGGQGYDNLLKAQKSDVITDKTPVKLYNILSDALKDAPLKYQSGKDYPHFIIETVN